MLLSFRIEFGFQMLYSRRQYHAAMKWDGSLECFGGKILKSAQLQIPRIWVSPALSPVYVPLPEPRWQITTRREVAGVAFEAEVEPDSIFELNTAAGTWEFRAAELLEKGHLSYHVGAKYAFDHLTITREGYYWFHPTLPADMPHRDFHELGLPVHKWARMDLAWLAPQREMRLELDFPEIPGGEGEYLLHAAMMISPRAYEADPVDIQDPDLPPERVCQLLGMKSTPWESQWHEEIPLEIQCDGVVVATGRQYFRDHDFFIQLLEDVWIRFRTTPGHHVISWKNPHPTIWMLFHRLTLQASPRPHCKLTIPRWSLTGEKLTGRIYATHADKITLETPTGEMPLSLQPGWNEFPICIPQAGTHLQFRAGEQQGEMEAVYDLQEESTPVLVGYDMTVVPHDGNGFMDWLLDYTDRTRLANMVVFRSFLHPRNRRDKDAVAPQLLERWGEYCRKHGIAVEAATDFESGVLAKAAGSAMHSAGDHELSGVVYAADPVQGEESRDMKEASNRFIAWMRKGVDAAHGGGCRAAFGEASGGIRYDYLAGADFVRAETMVPHTQHLCSQARAAAEALGDGEWGVHIAVQHASQPAEFGQCRRYFLSLYQPWMMGANMLYEEDSLFLYFKEERQTWCDALTRTKRNMTRDFLRFAKTHPRHGRVLRGIAFLEGRYAAPFNAFGCGPEQDPDYPVWGKYGSTNPLWGHRQPEKCRQLLNVLMPGASTIPLRQRADKRRFFFSGTPYGDFDEAPIEAATEYFQQYRLLLNLGWNTMLDEDYSKLLAYVKNGGVLLTGLPQFSTHVRRDFLKDMEDLALYRNGDLRELCGFRVSGRNGLFSGQWNCRGRADFPEPELIGLPSHSPEEDGPAWRAALELSDGAEVVAWDALDAAPLVIRHRVGRGWVYTLAFWAYPGHEAFQQLSATWLEELAGNAKTASPVRVYDASQEIFWTVRKDEGGLLLMMLNTDWTTPGNRQEVTVYTDGFSWEEEVAEGTPSLIRLTGSLAISYPAAMHVEVTEGNRLRVYGTGRGELTVHDAQGMRKIAVDFENLTEKDIQL